MQIFISEFLTCGAWNEADVPASLLREGTSMVSAIAWDFAQIPSCRVVMTWDQRFGQCPLEDTANIQIRSVQSPAEESAAFEELCREADAALIIAPEFQDLLADRCRRVRELGTASLNCSVEAIRQCTDKLELARQLESPGIPTIPTRALGDPQKVPASALEFPIIIKPRDGAGSQDTYLISNADEWREFQKAKGQDNATRTEWIVQPYVAGRTLSIAGIVGDPEWNEEPWLEIFPLAEQELTRDGRFSYLGGCVPQTLTMQHLAARWVRETARQLPGLAGYVGWDLLVPRHAPEELLIVEINPRLTTSYLGYRELAAQNLAEFFLPSYYPEEPLRWKPHTVRFTASGQISVEKRHSR